MRHRLTTISAILTSAVSGVALCPPAITHAQVRPPATAPAAHVEAQQQPQSVPVKEVVLFSSGVGYFEHFGTVKGDASTELHFKADQVNDMLKSLLLEDLDGGHVDAVTYASQAPLSHTLRSFQVDLSASPPLSQLLGQLRGAGVTATLPQGPVSGQVLAVESRKRPVGPPERGEVVESWVLDLLLAGGAIRPVPLEQVSEVRLDDAKLQQELVKALAAVAAARDVEQKPVAVRFSGQGERRVRIGYVVEAPVWKTSYRLVLGGDAGGTGEGEKGRAGEGAGKGEGGAGDAEALDAGAKRTTPRPAGPAASGGAGVTEKKGGEAAEAGSAGAKLQGWAIVENQTDGDWEHVQMSLVSGRPISFVQDLYQPLYVTRPLVEPELYASLRPQRYAEGLAEFGRKRDEAAVEKAEAQQESVLRRSGIAQDRARQLAAAPPAPMGAGAGGAKGGMAYNAAIDPTASIRAAASGTAVGEFFQYTVGDVSLPRQKSAMIPIVTDSVKARRLSIYNAGVFADHPLLGARLTNTTGKLLPQGPLTVLDGGSYAGDASITDLPAGQDRLLSYGIDQQVLVHNNDQTQDSSLVTAKVVKGVLELTYKQMFRQVYAAQNKGKTARTLLVEHPKRQGWTLIEPAKAQESTDTLYRFEEALPAGNEKKLTVREELTSAQGIAILPMDVSQIEVYLRTSQIPEKVKKALQQAAKLKYAMVDTDRQAQDRQQQIAEITAEQNRIRENMKAVAQNTDYYQRLVKELDAQETQLQKLKSELKDLRQKRDGQRKDLEDYLGGLSVG